MTFVPLKANFKAIFSHKSHAKSPRIKGCANTRKPSPEGEGGARSVTDEVLQTFPAAHKGLRNITFNMVGAGAHDSP